MNLKMNLKKIRNEHGFLGSPEHFATPKHILNRINEVQRETALAVWEKQWDFLHGLWYADKINQEIFDLFRDQLFELKKELGK